MEPNYCKYSNHNGIAGLVEMKDMSDRKLVPGVCMRDHPSLAYETKDLGALRETIRIWFTFSQMEAVLTVSLRVDCARSCYFFGNFQSDRIFKHRIACEQFLLHDTVAMIFLSPR